MKQTLLSLLLCVLVCTVGVAPQSVVANSEQNETDHRSALLQLIMVLQEQVIALRAQLAAENRLAVAEFDQPRLPYRSLYEYSTPASGTNLSLTVTSHEEFFERVLTLTPIEYRATLAGLIVYDGRSLTSDAYVYSQKLSDGSFRWFFGVNNETLNENLDAPTIDELIVHELGHIVGLRDSLQPGAELVCHVAIGFGENCPDPDSPLGLFINAFWPNELLNQQVSTEGRFRGNEVAGYERSFVSNYASIDSNEDFAESFMVYVLGRGNEYPSAVTAEKTQFFQQFPYYRALKTEILNQL